MILKIDRLETGVNTNAVFFFSLALNKDRIIEKADLNAREFFGENISSVFSELGSTEEIKQEIKDFLDTLPVYKEARVITHILDRNENPHLVDIIGRYREDGELCYTLEIWELPNLECEALLYRNNIWKYRLFLGLVGQSLFDYDIEKNFISIYRYVGNRSVRLFYDDFDVFIEKMIETSEKTEKNTSMIYRLRDSFKSGRSVLDASIRTGVLHEEKKLQNLLIRARYDDLRGTGMIFGVISNMNEDESDVPFYMTTAGIDSVTGLLNKRSLVEYSEFILTGEATKDRRHYMALLDIDNFKSINDNYGHQMGDKAILILANVLKDVIRDSGIIGRYGGDEFFILTDRIDDEETLRSLLRRIRANSAAAAKEKLGMEKFSVSIGVSDSTQDGKTFNELLTLADKSLYIAKEKGKDRYIIYRPHMHSDISVGSEKRGISSFDEQSKSINRVIKQLFFEKECVVADILKDVAKSFDLDSIDVFYKDADKPLFSEGKYPSGMTMRDFVSNQKYMARFDENGVHVMNNIGSLRHTNEKLFDLMEEKKCMSLLQVAQPNSEDPEYFFSCNMLNRIHKWSDAEVSNLGLLGALIYGVLSKKTE